MDEPLYQLVYVSSARDEFSEQDLADLLLKSRTRNAASQITGMLAYAKGNFMQVLEGPRKSVVETYDRITRDPRHRGVIKMFEAEVECRYFPEWSMGFECIRNKDDVMAIPGYQDLRELSQAELKSTGQKLIRSFARNMVGVG